MNDAHDTRTFISLAKVNDDGTVAAVVSVDVSTPLPYSDEAGSVYVPLPGPMDTATVRLDPQLVSRAKPPAEIPGPPIDPGDPGDVAANKARLVAMDALTVALASQGKR